MEICKSDVALVADYLDFAATHFATFTSSRMRNKSRLMRIMSNKFKSKLKNHATVD